jgi:hypothetical protein
VLRKAYCRGKALAVAWPWKSRFLNTVWAWAWKRQEKTPKFTVNFVHERVAVENIYPMGVTPHDGGLRRVEVDSKWLWRLKEASKCWRWVFTCIVSTFISRDVAPPGINETTNFVREGYMPAFLSSLEAWTWVWQLSWHIPCCRIQAGNPVPGTHLGAPLVIIFFQWWDIPCMGVQRRHW